MQPRQCWSDFCFPARRRAAQAAGDDCPLPTHSEWRRSSCVFIKAWITLLSTSLGQRYPLIFARSLSWSKLVFIAEPTSLSNWRARSKGHTGVSDRHSQSSPESYSTMCGYDCVSTVGLLSSPVTSASTALSKPAGNLLHAAAATAATNGQKRPRVTDPEIASDITLSASRPAQENK